MHNEIIFYITLIKLNTYLGLFKEILYTDSENINEKKIDVKTE